MIKKIIENKKIDYVIISVLVLLVSFVFIISLPKQFNLGNHAWLVIITIVINLIMSIYMIIKEFKFQGFSLSVVYWIFNFVFFSFMPLIQYLNNSFPWNSSFSDGDLVLANLIILLFNMFFLYIVYTKRLKKHKKVQVKINKNNFYNESINYTTLNIVTIMSLLIVLFIFIRVGFNDFFSREQSSFAFDLFEVGTLTSLLNCISRYFIAFTFLFNFMAFKRNKRRLIWFILSSIIFILGCFPFAMSRFVMAAIYFGIIFFICWEKNLNRYVLYFFIFAIMFVFPLMGGIRNLSFFQADFYKSLWNSFIKIKDVYLGGDYDAYTNLVKAIKYVEEFGHENCYQLLGCLLFFIPRKIWTTKPIGTGSMIYKKLGYKFTNVSMPYIGESFVNYSYTGVILFAVTLGYVTELLDEKKNKIQSSIFKAIYAFLVSIFFFMLRGDLMSSLSSIATLLLSGVIFFTILNFNHLVLNK